MAISRRMELSRCPSSAMSSGLRSSVQSATKEEVFSSRISASACKSLDTDPSRMRMAMPFASFSRASAALVASWSVRMPAAR
ncbi:hypothetical protein D3C86_2103250 [compost metagenome]